MIRTDRFVMSHRPYAIRLDSLRLSGESCWRVDAAWFRRRQGVTVACVGYLWDHQRTAPADVEEFLQRHDDGRYGGTCLGRWDGSGYWGMEDLPVVEEHLTVLRPMLDAYPAIPVGYDGWWTFRGE